MNLGHHAFPSGLWEQVCRAGKLKVTRHSRREGWMERGRERDGGSKGERERGKTHLESRDEAEFHEQHLEFQLHLHIQTHRRTSLWRRFGRVFALSLCIISMDPFPKYLYILHLRE